LKVYLSPVPVEGDRHLVKRKMPRGAVSKIDLKVYLSLLPVEGDRYFFKRKPSRRAALRARLSQLFIGVAQ